MLEPNSFKKLIGKIFLAIILLVERILYTLLILSSCLTFFTHRKTGFGNLAEPGDCAQHAYSRSHSNFVIILGFKGRGWLWITIKILQIPLLSLSAC